MRELQLIRSSEDKRRLDLDGVGSVRFENMWGTKLRISAPDGEWRIAGKRRGPVSVLDAAGTTVATIHGGRVVHGERVVDVAPAPQGLLGFRAPPFVLREGELELARVAPNVWNEKPLDVAILDTDFVDDEPLLFLLSLYAANRIASARMAAATVHPANL